MTSPKPVKPTRRKQRGSALVESTICFLGFMFLTLGLVEFSMAVYAYNFVTYGAQTGAHYASLHGFHSGTPASTDQIRDVVRAQSVALVRSRVNVETTWVPNNHPGSVVQVKVTYVVNPLVNMMLRGAMTVSSTSKLVISN